MDLPLDVPLIQFAWDKELGYHTYIGEKSKDFKLQRKIEDLTSLAEDVFRETETVTFNDLINALAETMGVKERMSRNYIQFMLENSIVAPLPKSKLFKLGMSVNK